MIALAAAAAVTAAVPAVAAQRYDRYSDQQRQEGYQNYSLSEHCQQVMNRPDMWGDKEVTYCRDNL
jgi:opacity protein-like surface antigen